MWRLVCRMCAPDSPTAETAPRFDGPAPPDGPERAERLRALEAHRARLAARFVQHAHSAVSVQHAWRAHAAKLARSWRQTARDRQATEDSLGALRSKGHEVKAPKGQAARVARLRASWAEIERFVDAACRDGGAVHAVVIGNANTVHLDGSDINASARPLVHSHGRDVLTRPSSDPRMAGSRGLSLVEFFESWAGALEQLKTGVRTPTSTHPLRSVCRTCGCCTQCTRNTRSSMA